MSSITDNAFSRGKGIWLEDRIAKILRELKEKRRIVDFYYEPVLRYYDQDVRPDFIVMICEKGQTKADIVEAKDWATVIVLHKNHVQKLCTIDRKHNAGQLLEQMWRFDIGFDYDRRLGKMGVKRRELIIVTSSCLHERTPTTTRTVQHLVKSFTTRLRGEYDPFNKSHIHILSPDLFQKMYPDLHQREHNAS